MKQIKLDVKHKKIAALLDTAKSGEIVFTINGKPAGFLHAFADDDDWFDYKLFSDPRFIKRIEQERENARKGLVYTSEQVDEILQADERNRANPSVVSEAPAPYSKSRKTTQKKRE